MLSQIVLKEKRLNFYFKTHLDLLDPNKILSVLSEICINADHYDDIFIDELGASRIKSMNVKSYTNEELQNLWHKYQATIAEIMTYIEHFEKKRLLVNAIEIIQALIYRLRYYMEPQGVLAADIGSIIQICKQEMAENQKLEQLITSIKKLSTYTEEKFVSCMYIPTFLIQPKRAVSLHFVQDYFSKYINQSKKWLDQGQYVDVVTGQMFDTYSILDEYQPPITLEKKLIQALTAASGQPWKKAAQLLYDVDDEILELEALPANFDNPLELGGQMMSDKLNKFFGLWK
jgi:hypothetical protein